ncbi:MAG: acyltransferase family protein [Lachnospiraceae bacterium]|nr:acyltransferase family protein [Lachnospiraceae bacterium]
MEKSGRLAYMDMVKGIAIILVVLGHSPVVSDGVLTWLTSFHMPLFFILSGILFYLKHSHTEDLKDYALKRFRGMMIPYFIFSVVYIGVFYYYLARFPEVMTMAFIRESYLQALSLYGISVLWFLPTIFFGELVFYGLMKRLPRWAVVLIISVFAFLPPFLKSGLDVYLPDSVTGMTLFARYFFLGLIRIPEAVAFLGIGYGVRYLCDVYTRRRGQVQSSVEVLMGVGLMLLHAAAAFGNERVDMHFIVQGDPILFHVAACSATFGLLLICKHLPKVWLLDVLGVNSLIVMLTHLDCQVLSYGVQFASKMNEFITRAKDYFYILNLFAFILVAEIILIYVINRWLYFLIGKSKPVKTELPKWIRRRGLKVVK